ncbi:MAG: PEP-CTERM sorting domain-containing protein [Isosphaeraceae bacterium]
MTFATRLIAAVRSAKATAAVAVLVAAASMATAPATARAGSITYITSSGASTTGGLVDAKAVFTLGNGTINITLSNLLPNPKADSQLISGLNFDLTGATYSVTSLASSGDMTMLASAGHNKGYTYSGKTSTNPLPAWEAASSTANSNTAITLSALTGGKPSGLIIGPDSSGGFPTSGSYTNANSSIGEHPDVVLGTATFTIDISGVTASSQLSEVNFVFGTENPPTGNLVAGQSVPEPSTMVMGLSATAMVAGVLIRRRRRTA